MGTAPRRRQVNPIDLTRASDKVRRLVEVDGVICFYAECSVNPSVDPNWLNSPWVLYKFDEECGKRRVDADLEFSDLLDNIAIGVYDHRPLDL
jgi:hypothetical protein